MILKLKVRNVQKSSLFAYRATQNILIHKQLRNKENNSAWVNLNSFTLIKLTSLRWVIFTLLFWELMFSTPFYFLWNFRKFGKKYSSWNIIRYGIDTTQKMSLFKTHFFFLKGGMKRENMKTFVKLLQS